MKRPRCFSTALAMAFMASAPLHAASPPDTPAGKIAALDADRRLIAFKEIWLLAVALEAYAVDHLAYPIPASAPVPTVRLAGALAPTYLPTVPAKDPWCSDYLYWSNGTDYVIASYSSDTASDFSYSSLVKKGFPHFKSVVCTGSSEAPGADTVFTDGVICRWHGAKPDDPWR